ncbi:MAG: ATP synthase F1 subunit epsilon [Eubacterium sp.]|nr:ATP synthase F1 subunit epsilon [Eubacterium sp.]
MAGVFQLKVLASDAPFYEGPCTSLIVPMNDGLYGIMAKHVNTIGAVHPGEMTIKPPEGEPLIAAVASGIFKIEDNEVLVLVETAERPEDIDLHRAQRSEAAAREELLQKRSMREYNEAQMWLARAVTRRKVYHRHRKND